MSRIYPWSRAAKGVFVRLDGPHWLSVAGSRGDWQWLVRDKPLSPVAFKIEGAAQTQAAAMRAAEAASRKQPKRA